MENWILKRISVVVVCFRRPSIESSSPSLSWSMASWASKEFAAVFGAFLLQLLDVALGFDLVLQFGEFAGFGFEGLDLDVEVFDIDFEAALAVVGPAFELVHLLFEVVGILLGDLGEDGLSSGIGVLAEVCRNSGCYS